MSMFTTHMDKRMHTLNVSSSYLTRLVSIARASIQYFSLEDDDELMDKKRIQIVSMFDLHNTDEFTSFYDEEMEMTNEIKEFMAAMGAMDVVETKFEVKPSNVWSIPSNVLMYSIGRIVDTMDPTFTEPQYVTIAALSYFHHLKETKPEAVEGFILKIVLLENEHLYIDTATQSKMATWVPLSIQTHIQSGIRSDPLRLVQVYEGKVSHFSLSSISGLILNFLRAHAHSTPHNVNAFWAGLHNLLPECKYPVSRRIWSEQR
jgi:hypothetical protein